MYTNLDMTVQILQIKKQDKNDFMSARVHTDASLYSLLILSRKSLLQTWVIETYYCVFYF